MNKAVDEEEEDKEEEEGMETEAALAMLKGLSVRGNPCSSFRLFLCSCFLLMGTPLMRNVKSGGISSCGGCAWRVRVG